MAQHVARHGLQVQARHIDFRQHLRHAAHVAVHARRLAEQHVHRHVDREVLGGLGGGVAVDHLQLLFVRGEADHRERCALALAHGLEAREIARGDGQRIALLRFVAPDFSRAQARLFQVHLAQVEACALVGAVHEFGEGVGDAARAHVVDRQDRVVLTQRPAGVDDFLRAALHLGVAALHGIEVQVGGVGAGRHRAGGAAAHADAHARAAQLHQQRAGRQVVLVGVAGVDAADATGDHDGLVVTAHRAAHVLLVDAEIAAQVGPAEFVVEGRATDRAFDHDLQRRGDALRLADRARHLGIGVAVRHGLGRVAGVFPRLHGLGQQQVRHREAGQARLGLGAAAGRAFVADLAARARGGAGERRDGGRMVVRLHLHQRVRERLVAAVVRHADLRLGARAREPALGHAAFHDGGVVRIRHHRALRRQLVRVADHREQRLVLALAVDGPIGVEDLVTAVFAVGLREHHQLDVGRVAAELAVGVDQVVDLVVGQRQAHLGVGDCQRTAAGGGIAAAQVDEAQRLGRQRVEQAVAVFARGDHGLGHAIVQVRGDSGARGLVQLLAAASQATKEALLAGDGELHAALDAVDLRQRAMAGDFRRLAGPRRDRAEARNHHKAVALGLGRRGRAVGQQRLDARRLIGRQRRIGGDEVQVLGTDGIDVRIDALERGEQALLAEGGQRESAGKARKMRHGGQGRQ